MMLNIHKIVGAIEVLDQASKEAADAGSDEQYAAAAAGLREAVRSMVKTADGVPIVPGMEVWLCDPVAGIRSVRVTAVGEHSVYEGPTGHPRPIEPIYVYTVKVTARSDFLRHWPGNVAALGPLGGD
ncbi:MAG TPA: hypothetical protein VHM90_14985 [Phycisphaerae bacterium]|nr:hypothetical protein [Phycisphaerae bacterium]